jgi:uncharacterized protein (DUF1800 family)
MTGKALFAILLAMLLAACATTSRPSGVRSLDPNPRHPLTHAQASRFLQQATFGPTMAEIEQLRRAGYAGWLDEQFRMPQTDVLPQVEAYGQRLVQEHYFRAFWKTAATAPDQLRQRVAFALSQVFVVSFDSMLSNRVRAVASYHDMLARNAFGNFRTLLEDVSLHPAMGVYLSHLKNRKEDPATNRVPDENYAREVMQLFTIGLHELNVDGTLKLKDGQPIETYDNNDITGLAKVFTGFSYGGAGSNLEHFFRAHDRDWEVLPMKAYPRFHSTSEKRFLGLVIPAQRFPDPKASLTAALDHLFHHPNVGPFIGKLLIQRLVTSNPSPAYVRRVALAFNDNGAGVRGDMRAVIRAVLLDPEARSTEAVEQPGFGKVREPILRLSQWMRAFHAQSLSGEFRMPNTDNPGMSLGQTPMRSPSVFNFYRPGYVPPGTAIAKANLVAPEMQIVSENSVAGYANFMQGVIERGVGQSLEGKRDIQPDYSELIGLADSPEKLVEYVDVLLAAGQLSDASRARIREAIASVPLSSMRGAADAARQNRARLAILLTMVSPEYLVQK